LLFPVHGRQIGARAFGLERRRPTPVRCGRIGTVTTRAQL
jgi:hypothetical protein